MQFGQIKKDPKPVLAYELVLRLLTEAGEHQTPPGKYALERLKTKARHAERREIIHANAAPQTPDKKEYQRWFNKADKFYSIYIRLRDTAGPLDNNYQDRQGYCCTCRKLKPWFLIQCGHWQVRELYGTRWHEWNSHGQCRWCNSKEGGNGEVDKHQAVIAALYGPKAPERLEALTVINAKKPGLHEVKAIAMKYENLIAQIHREAA